MTVLSAKPVRRSFPDIVPYVRFCLGQIRLPMLIIPPIAAVSLGIACYYQGAFVQKHVVEAAALIVLGAAMLVGGLQWAIKRDAFAGWVLGVTLALFCRELHFMGTSSGVYVALVFLALFAWFKYPWFADYLAHRRNLTLLAMAMFTYALSVSIDQHWWQFDVILNMGTTLEECLEIVGHAFVLLLALTMRKGKGVLLYPQATWAASEEITSPTQDTTNTNSD